MNPTFTVLNSNNHNITPTRIMAFSSLKDMTSRKKKLRDDGQMNGIFQRLSDDDLSFVGHFDASGKTEAEQSQNSIYSESSEENHELEDVLLLTPQFHGSYSSSNNTGRHTVSPLDSPAKCIQLIQCPESSLSTLEMSLTSLEGLEVAANDLSRPFLAANPTALTKVVSPRRQRRSKSVDETKVLLTKERKRKTKKKRKEKSLSPFISVSKIEQSPQIPLDRRAYLVKSKTTTTMAQWKLPGPAFDSPKRHPNQASLRIHSRPNHAA